MMYSMKKVQLTAEAYTAPQCSRLPMVAEGVLCGSYGASAEGFDENEKVYDWGE